MQRKYIPAITMLTAGAVTCIVSIANNIDKLTSLEILLGVLIVFYIIGLIAKAIISKVLDSGGVLEQGQEKGEGTSEEEPEESEEENAEQMQDEESVQIQESENF